MLQLWVVATLVGGLAAAGARAVNVAPDLDVAVSRPRSPSAQLQAVPQTSDPVAPSAIVTTTTVRSAPLDSPSPPTTTSPPTPTTQPDPQLDSAGPLVDENLRFGDPNAEMPAEWLDLCIPGTWVPEYRSCTFKPSRLTGTVRDSSGRTIPNMCIGALMQTWSRSDAAGTWIAEVSGFSGGGRVWDCGNGSTFGYQPQEVAFTLQIGRTTNIDVVVIPFGGVRGRVLDPHGRPVPGACVASGGRQDLPPVGPTASDGRFQLSGVIPGSHQVFLRPCPGADGMNMLDLEPTIVTSESGTWTDVDISVILAQ